ncbi:Rieske (2Fe-2S) protein [Microbacterium sp.]|uniref:Rieske (2Fe-2S) protein n=1 Tax=Microbacterium sp. TaxID=51671 RepID=UPI003A8BC209
MSIADESREVRVASLADLTERGRLILDVDGVVFGLYAHRGEVRAWRNTCPHQGGPVCQGKTMARTVHVFDDGGLVDAGPGLHETDRHIVCPWHGFEFDVLTGAHAVASHVRLSGLTTRVDGDDVYVML